MPTIIMQRVAKVAPQQRGFTLTELLAVMAILGILAGLVSGAVGGLGTSGQQARLAGDRVTIGTAVDRFFNLSYPQSYPILSYADSDASLTTAGDLGVRLIDFDARLPQDPDQTFTPDFLKEIPESAAIVSWRMDTARGIMFFAREGAQLIPPAQSRLDVVADDKRPGLPSGYTFKLRMKKNEASITDLVVEIPQKYQIGGKDLTAGTLLGRLTGTIIGDNPWVPGLALNITGELRSTGVDNVWTLTVDYPDSVNNPASVSVPPRPDKAHRLTLIESSSDIPGKYSIQIDRTDELTEHNLADERWNLIVFSSVSDQGVTSNLITNPDTPGVYRWLAQEATTVDLEETLDSVPGSQSIIVK